MDNTRGLFRGKRTDNGEWVEGGYFPAPNVAIRGKLNHFIVTTNSLGTIMYFEIDPSTRGEYTGLIDKNGKMIFEGDIIRADWQGKKVAVVTFEGGMFKAHGLSLITWVAGPGYCPEVIGNIHDNGELMGGQDG